MHSDLQPVCLAILNIIPTDTYYKCTMNIVVNQLRVLLVGVIDLKKRSTIWSEWVEAWSQFPLIGFLRSTKDTVVEQLPSNFKKGLDQLDLLLPWPEPALVAYEAFTYTQSLDASMVGFLREMMGQWWSPNMHHIDGGMSMLPRAFENELKEHIVTGYTVTDIEYESPSNDLHKKVTVRALKTRRDGTRVPFTFTGHAVIVTTPVNILRQIKFASVDTTEVTIYPHGLDDPHDPLNQDRDLSLSGPFKPKVAYSVDATPPIPDMFYKAIENISYGASTKIMLQCKTRFWEKEGIKGGFTKTNLPIGQIHYPSNTPHGGIKEGILLVYTWKSEALLFGALGENLAVQEAVRQIASIHPEIKKEFQMGKAKSWYNEPAQQGAYALLKPRQEHNVRWLMYPWRNIYFAGEAISFASGWIQGAMESGLRAAYQFYTRNENSIRE